MDHTLIPSRWFDVTPSDSASISPAIGLYVGNAGTVKAAGMDGTVGTYICQAGQYLTGRFTKVLATGTTATGIVALLRG